MVFKEAKYYLDKMQRLLTYILRIINGLKIQKIIA